MALTRQSVEQRFFRALNQLVEPAVRRGIGSPRLAPAGLIVLETIGFKTGQTRRTPLLSARLGKYVFISTARGGRSFWVKNLLKQSGTRFYMGGKMREAEAFLVMPGETYQRPESLPGVIGRITDRLAPLADRGWAFAVLAPARIP
jgi:deazaflavin-dependent oxidoreductase (nitroreductase family)